MVVGEGNKAAAVEAPLKRKISKGDRRQQQQRRRQKLQLEMKETRVRGGGG